LRFSHVTGFAFLLLAEAYILGAAKARLRGDMGAISQGRSRWSHALLSACLGLLVLAPSAALSERVQTLAAAKPAPGGERRVALVIGNGAYKAAPLRNPANDARAMARALSETGFNVTLLEEATRSSMRRAVREFGDEIARGGVGLFFFAGHGMQIRGRNYLVPVNADIQREDEVEDEAVDANTVLAKMDSAKNTLNVLILDACRNNPFQRAFRSAQQGLAQMDAPSGTLVAFATAPGSVAADGDGANGVYTKHLLVSLRTPGLPVEQLFKQVRIGVAKETADRQIPWESSSLKGDFYFVAPDPGQGAAGQYAAIQKAVTDATRAAEERAARERSEMQAQMRRLIEEMMAKQQAMLDAERKARGEAAAVASAPAPKAGEPAVLAPATAPVARPAPAPVAVVAPQAPVTEKPQPALEVASAAPSQAGAPRKPGFPAQGDRWVYRAIDSNRADAKAEFTVEVQGTADNRVLERVRRGTVPAGQWVHTPGVYLTGGTGLPVPEFSPYLATFGQLRVGDRWADVELQSIGLCTSPTVDCAAEGRVVSKERISVQGVTYDTYRIEVVFQARSRGHAYASGYRLGGGNAVATYTYWYSEQIGRAVKLQSRGDRSATEHVDVELISYNRE
jgi:uncharacterized caspase-like protein